MSILEEARAMLAELDAPLSHRTPLSSVPWDSGHEQPFDGTFGTVWTDGTLGGSPPCPCDIAERAATRSESADGDLANKLALREAGFSSWQALVEVQCAEIAMALDQLSAPCDENGRRLLQVTQQFVASQWFAVALESGWTTLELFGIDDHAPLDHCEQWGLVTGLALAPRRGDMIESINGERAVIWYRSRSKIEGIKRIERRFTPAEGSVPWWECMAIQGGDVEDWTH